MAVTKKKSSAKAWEIGGAIAASAVAAAAAAYLLTDNKTKHKAKAWVSQAKKEIAKQAKSAKKLGQREYDRMVDQAVKKYGSLENITAADVIATGKQLKGDWDRIHQHAAQLAHSSKKKSVARRSRSPRPGTKTKAKSAAKKKSRR